MVSIFITYGCHAWLIIKALRCSWGNSRVMTPCNVTKCKNTLFIEAFQDNETTKLAENPKKPTVQ